jgi:hydrogenase/urease accessory protein HupE
MIFLIIQTIKENTNPNGFVEMMASSSVLGYLFFRKIKQFKQFDNRPIVKRYFILSLISFGLLIVLSKLMVWKIFLIILGLFGAFMLLMSVMMILACNVGYKSHNGKSKN